MPSGQPLDQGRDEVTLAEALTGYRSAFIGKWHLGNYDPAKETRSYPFVDLRAKLLSPERAIRSANPDPRLQELIR